MSDDRKSAPPDVSQVLEALDDPLMRPIYRELLRCCLVLRTEHGGGGGAHASRGTGAGHPSFRHLRLRAEWRSVMF
jgi:hypothetical protein